MASPSDDICSVTLCVFHAADPRMRAGVWYHCENYNHIEYKAVCCCCSCCLLKGIVTVVVTVDVTSLLSVTVEVVVFAVVFVVVVVVTVVKEEVL